LSGAGPDRRGLLRRALVLGAGAAGFLALRRQLAWPTPRVSFGLGDWSGWIGLPLRDGLVQMAARIGGVEVQAVVDSGAQYSAIDSALASRLALPGATPLPIVAFGVSGDPSLTRAVALDVDLGALSVHGLRAAALSLAPLSGLTRQPFSLLLGRDLLRAATLEADFPGARAAFFRPEAWRPPAGALPVPVRLQSGALMTKVQVEQAAPVEVMVDTGATGALALSEETARTVGLLDGRPLRRGESVTLGGVSQDGMAHARQVTFGGHPIPHLEVQIYRPAPNSPAPAGLIGLGILSRFHLALDHAAGRLFLIGGEHPPSGHRVPIATSLVRR
jgi:predicted aspartyl protease